MRPLIQTFPQFKMEVLLEWSCSENAFVRRCASECMRVRLPWAKKMTAAGPWEAPHGPAGCFLLRCLIRTLFFRASLVLRPLSRDLHLVPGLLGLLIRFGRQRGLGLVQGPFHQAQDELLLAEPLEERLGNLKRHRSGKFHA